jgi:arginine decarboxylase
MLKGGEELIPLKVLIIDDELDSPTAIGRALQALVRELHNRDVEVIQSISAADGESIIRTDPSLQCILLDWDLKTGDDLKSHRSEKSLLSAIRSRNERIPIFLFVSPGDASSLTAEAMRQADELVWLLEDTPFFIAGRIQAAMRRYRDAIAPPFNKALMAFAKVYEYSWHTPGHTGGTAFLKSPIGRAFYEYFGENLLRSDLSISVGELGSLLDHSGPIGESEKYAARVFGAHRSYTVTNGSSTSNRVIMMSSATHGDLALCDRNAHKSTEQALTMTGVLPTYLLPSRNYLGIIGPIYPERLQPESIDASIKANPLTSGSSQKPVHAIITNSTYDGLCYNARRVVELLGQSVDRIHFDEAWYGYARFNPIYKDRYGMYGDPKDYPPDAPTIFTTTSTHKLLAALSQASFIHIRDGRNPVEHGRFNESFMMHASTSPQYAIIASNEVSAAMMEGIGGLNLTAEAIAEAVAFRQAVWRVHRGFQFKGDWFFTTWNADEVKDPATGKRIAFENAPATLLVTDPDCWVLHPGDAWHGFKGLEDGYCMLDPIKVSVVTPGVKTDGSFEESGIPASLVTAYLDHVGIEVEKTTDFTILFLFSIGVTKGKWGTLINALLDFKADYDANKPLVECLPVLAASHPDRYQGMGLRDLADEMFTQHKKSNLLQLQSEAFSSLPKVELTPQKTYSRLVHNEIEKVAVDELADRTLATGIVPYPPGIPMLMPGENAGPDDGPCIGYLRALQAWDRRFPGFEHETHGVESEEGIYYVFCLK